MTKIIEFVSWKQHKKNMDALKNRVWLLTKVVTHIKKTNTKNPKKYQAKFQCCYPEAAL